MNDERQKIDEQLIFKLRKAQEYLRSCRLDDIIGLCDVVSRKFSPPSSPSQTESEKFLESWLRKSNLEILCDTGFRGNRMAIDGFVPVLQGSTKLHRAHPRGLVVHWLAGNVATLGTISVVQALLTKNASLAKISSKDTGQLGSFISALSSARYERSSGEVVHGSEIADSICMFHVSQDDYDIAQRLSLEADVRVAWGDHKAVAAITELPKRPGTEDIVFGPKTSLAAIGAEKLVNLIVARGVARLLALDAAALDQRGCNSPHTVFVEAGGAVSPVEFAKLLSDELQEICKDLPLPSLSVAEAYRGYTVRSEYAIRGHTWHGCGTSWAILFAEADIGLADPCYGRTLFVRPVNDLFDIVPHCSGHTQTVGLAVGPRRLSLADALTSRGVARCPELGRMTKYDMPWDGLYSLDRMVRWVSA